MHRPMMHAPMPLDICHSGQNEVTKCTNQGSVASGTFCARLPMVTWNTHEWRLANGVDKPVKVPRKKAPHKHEAELRVLKGMRRRCTNPKHPAYRLYGGRGIVVCERWNAFSNFLADMGPRPGPEYSIDRIDTNGNYEPGNCRWSTITEQARNRRTNRFIVAFGEAKTISAWAEDTRCVVSKATLAHRTRKGWDPEVAITTPPAPGCNAAWRARHSDEPKGAISGGTKV